MKLNETVSSVIDFGLKHFGEVYMLVDMVGNILGKTPPENAPPDKKGAYGLFGKEDERSFERLRLKLTADEFKKLNGFIRWHFKTTGLIGGVTAWWVMNAWRTFTTKLSTSAKKTGTVVNTTSSKDKDSGETTSSKTTTDTFSAGGDQSLEFLKRIIQIIDEHPGDEEAGYQAVIDYFETAGVPTMPDAETLAKFQDFLNTIPATAIAVKDMVKVKVPEITGHIASNVPVVAKAAVKKAKATRRKLHKHNQKIIAKRPKGLGWLWSLLGG